MAKEYIEREALLDAIINDCPDLIFYSKREAIECIVAEPAADVVEVVHGEWVENPTGRYGAWQSWCTACGQHSGIGGIMRNRHRPYCPNCGARMDGDTNV